MKTSGREGRVRIQKALGEREIDVQICELPTDVLMMSGYWPAVGTGVAAAFAGGPIGLPIPEDEPDLAASGWAHEVSTFHPVSLQKLETAAEAITKRWSIGYEACC